MYLRSINLLSEDEEWKIIMNEKRRIYNNIYPLKIFPDKKIETIEFAKTTIFYGGNGSGKSTLLNIIADSINASIKSKFEKGIYFDEYVKKINYKIKDAPKEIKIITSDDVFDYMLDVKSVNSKINRLKDKITDEYFYYKDKESKEFYNDFEKMKNKIDANSKTLSAYVRDRLATNNYLSESNGETALRFFEDEINDDSLYILDEPENSLSATNQIKLKKFLEESVRFFNCQFIIATHSPFLLNFNDDKIYDLDEIPVKEKKWSELENVRVYYNFFKDNIDDFK